MRRNAIGVILAGVSMLLPAYAQTVTVSPSTAYVHLSTFYQFAAKVTGTSPTTVGWTVRLPDGATGSPGTISAGGRYTPPAAIPRLIAVPSSYAPLMMFVSRNRGTYRSIISAFWLNPPAARTTPRNARIYRHSPN